MKKHNISETGNVVFFHCYLGKIRTIDKVRKPNISVCYTPSSEPYRVYLHSYCFPAITFFKFLGVGWDSPLGKSATIWPAVAAPDDRWWMWSSRWNENWQGKPKYSKKACFSSILSTKILHDLTRKGIRAAAVESRRPTASAIARNFPAISNCPQKMLLKKVFGNKCRSLVHSWDRMLLLLTSKWMWCNINKLNPQTLYVELANDFIFRYVNLYLSINIIKQN
jgi:hypothetical protein